MLNRIQVKGFKSIRELDLELRPLNVLIGANGSGKSNLLEVFRLMREVVLERLQSYVAKRGGADNLLHMGQASTRQITLEAYFDELAYILKLGISGEDRLLIDEEYCVEIKKKFARIVHKGITESKLREYAYKEDLVYKVLENLNQWKTYHFHDTSETSKIKVTNYIGDDESLHGDGSNLAAYLYMLQKAHPHKYNLIVKTVRRVFPSFDDFDLRPIPENTETIILRWREKGWDRSLPASLLSDGTLRFICLCTLLLQPNLPSLILIDEPELGLHPSAIILLASMFEMASKRTQVIVATHSTTLINQLAPEHVVVVERAKDGQSKFKRLELEPLKVWLEEYGLGELWEKNVLNVVSFP